MLKEVRTSKDLQILLSELDGVILELSGDTKGDTKSVVKENSPEAGDYLNFYLDEIKATNKEDSLRGLNKLREGLEKSKTLEINLAVNPNEALISSVFNWVKKNIGNDVILEIKTNPLLVGGAVLSFEGKYEDYSIRKKLRNEFKERQKGKEQ